MIKKGKKAGIKHLNDPNAFMEFSNIMDDVYENINDYNLSRKKKILIVFDEMIADMMTNLKTSAHNQRIVYSMQKIKYFTCVYHTTLLSCSKRCQIKFNKLFDYENQ